MILSIYPLCLLEWDLIGNLLSYGSIDGEPKST